MKPKKATQATFPYQKVPVRQSSSFFVILKWSWFIRNGDLSSLLQERMLFFMHDPRLVTKGAGAILLSAYLASLNKNL